MSGLPNYLLVLSIRSLGDHKPKTSSGKMCLMLYFDPEYAASIGVLHKYSREDHS